MSIARFARHEKMKHGWQREIAKRLKVSDSDVSKVMNDNASDLSPEKIRRIQVAIARRLKMRVDECFPPAVLRQLSA